MNTQTALTIAPLRSIEERADLRAMLDDWQATIALRVRSGELSETSRRTYVIGAMKFFDWCSGFSIVTDDTIREWMAELRANGRKPATVNTWLAGLRSFFSWAVGARRLPYNPA